jgi:hypothetical protein
MNDRRNRRPVVRLENLDRNQPLVNSVKLVSNRGVVSLMASQAFAAIASSAAAEIVRNTSP